MLTEKRKRGGQPENFNALKHGRRSARKRAERRAAVQVTAQERRRLEAEWAASVPKTDYEAIVEKLNQVRCSRPAKPRVAIVRPALNGAGRIFLGQERYRAWA